MDHTYDLPQIRKHYGTLTAAEKRIADYILRDPSHALTLSASALAQQAGTAASAVVRFCKSLGYTGYAAFRVHLAVMLSHESPASYLTGVEPDDDSGAVLKKIMNASIKAIRDTITGIDRKCFTDVVDALSGGEKIYIYGIGTSSGLVGELQHRLMVLGLSVSCYTDVVAMRLSTMNLTPADVVVGISHSGRTKAVVDAMSLSRKAGATTVCITSNPTSGITRFSDLVLPVLSDETGLCTEASTARIAQTAVVDALVAAVSARRFDTAVARSEQVRILLEDLRQGEKERK